MKTILERSQKTKPINTWAFWRLTPSNKWKWTTKFNKNFSGEQENNSRLSSQNLIEGINILALLHGRYSEPILKWTREQESLWPCIRHYIPEMTLTDYMYQEKRICQHWRQRWCIDTMIRSLYTKTRSRTHSSISQTIEITRWTTEWQ